MTFEDISLHLIAQCCCCCVQEGFARLATHKYTSDPKDIRNKFIHLTNSAIQKDSDRTATTLTEETYVEMNNGCDAEVV